MNLRLSGIAARIDINKEEGIISTNHKLEKVPQVLSYR